MVQNTLAQWVFQGSQLTSILQTGRICRFRRGLSAWHTIDFNMVATYMPFKYLYVHTCAYLPDQFARPSPDILADLVNLFGILERTANTCTLEQVPELGGVSSAVSSAKFYFFDVGVANVLAKRGQIQPKTELFGKVLEHFIFTELRAFLAYSKDRRELTFFRSRTSWSYPWKLFLAW